MDVDVGTALPVRFVWDHGGRQVWACITGPDGDTRAVELIRNRAGVFEVIVVLPVGRYEYRYAVDKTWTFDSDLPALRNKSGHFSNMVKVKADDDNLHSIINTKVPKSENLAAASAAQVKKREVLKSLSAGNVPAKKATAMKRSDLERMREQQQQLREQQLELQRLQQDPKRPEWREMQRFQNLPVQFAVGDGDQEADEGQDGRHDDDTLVEHESSPVSGTLQDDWTDQDVDTDDALSDRLLPDLEQLEVASAGDKGDVVFLTEIDSMSDDGNFNDMDIGDPNLEGTVDPVEITGESRLIIAKDDGSTNLESDKENENYSKSEMDNTNLQADLGSKCLINSQPDKNINELDETSSLKDKIKVVDGSNENHLNVSSEVGKQKEEVMHAEEEQISDRYTKANEDVIGNEALDDPECGVYMAKLVLAPAVRPEDSAPMRITIDVCEINTELDVGAAARTAVSFGSVHAAAARRFGAETTARCASASIDSFGRSAGLTAVAMAAVQSYLHNKDFAAPTWSKDETTEKECGEKEHARADNCEAVATLSELESSICSGHNVPEQFLTSTPQECDGSEMVKLMAREVGKEVAGLHNLHLSIWSKHPSTSTSTPRGDVTEQGSTSTEKQESTDDYSSELNSTEQEPISESAARYSAAEPLIIDQESRLEEKSSQDLITSASNELMTKGSESTARQAPSENDVMELIEKERPLSKEQSEPLQENQAKSNEDAFQEVGSVKDREASSECIAQKALSVVESPEPSGHAQESSSESTVKPSSAMLTGNNEELTSAYTDPLGPEESNKDPEAKFNDKSLDDMKELGDSRIESGRLAASFSSLERRSEPRSIADRVEQDEAKAEDVWVEAARVAASFRCLDAIPREAPIFEEHRAPQTSESSSPWLAAAAVAASFWCLYNLCDSAEDWHSCCSQNERRQEEDASVIMAVSGENFAPSLSQQASLDEILRDFDEILLEKINDPLEGNGADGKADKRFLEGFGEISTNADDIGACGDISLESPNDSCTRDANEPDSDIAKASDLGRLARSSPARSTKARRDRLHKKGKKKKTDGLQRSSSTEGERDGQRKEKFYDLRRSKTTFWPFDGLGSSLADGMASGAPSAAEDLFSEVRTELRAIFRCKSEGELQIQSNMRRNNTSRFLKQLKNKKFDSFESQKDESESDDDSGVDEIEKEDDPVAPVMPMRPWRKYADMPKKMDAILGPMRSEPVAVFLPKGDYSVAGLSERVHLKAADVRKARTAGLGSRKADLHVQQQQRESQQLQGEVHGIQGQHPVQEHRIQESQAPLLPKEEQCCNEPSASDPDLHVKTLKALDPTDLSSTDVTMISEEEAIVGTKRQTEEESKVKLQPQATSLGVPVQKQLIQSTREEFSDRQTLKIEPLISFEELRLDNTTSQEQEDLNSTVVEAQLTLLVGSHSKAASASGSVRIGINGLERTGCQVLLAALERGLVVAAINEPFLDAGLMAHAIKYEIAHSNSPTIKQMAKKTREPPARGTSTGQLVVFGNVIGVFDFKSIAEVPWDHASVNCVIETSATSLGEAKKHKAPKVIIAGPSEDAPLLCVGLMHGDNSSAVVSHASVAASALLLVLGVVERLMGVSSCAYTLIRSVKSSRGGGVRCPGLGPSGSRVLDVTHWNFEETLVVGGSQHVEVEVFRVAPALRGRVGGTCVYSPAADVSMLDMVVRVRGKKDPLGTIRAQLKHVIGQTGLPIRVFEGGDGRSVASSAFEGETSCVLDLSSSRLVSPDTVKLIVFFAQETAMAARIIDLATALSL